LDFRLRGWKLADEPQVIGTTQGGSTVNPLYKERRGSTYPISETDLMNISSLTAEPTRLYSLGGFTCGVLTNILVSYGASSTLTPVAEVLFSRVSWFFGAAALVFFIWGYAISLDKDAIVNRIRMECGVEPQLRLGAIIYEACVFRLTRYKRNTTVQE
jgi:hypothetical protein